MNAVTKCPGCGSYFQTTDPLKPGFVDEGIWTRENKVCARCFSLTNYGKVKEVNFYIDSKNFKGLPKDAIFIYVIDAFFLENSLIEELLTFLQNRQTIVVLNKMDLVTKFAKEEKLVKRVEEIFVNHNVNPLFYFTVSKNQKDSIKELYDSLTTLKNKHVYFVGATNAGKSTIINELVFIYEKKKKITVSVYPNTTLNFIEEKLGDNLKIIDTPGFINPQSAHNFLSPLTIKQVSLKRETTLKSYQLNPESDLLIGGFIKLSFLEGKRSTFVIKSPNLVIHKTKTINSENFFKFHKFDLLKLPSQDDVKLLGLFKKTKTFTIENNSIIIPGLLSIRLVGEGKVKITTWDNLTLIERKENEY